MSESIQTHSLQTAFAGLLLLAIASTAHTGFLSKTPAAIEPSLNNLSVSGFKLDAIAGSEPAKEKDYANSTVYRWNAVPVVPGQTPFKLEAVVLHNRTSVSLGINELVRNAGLPAGRHEVQTLKTDAGKPAEEVAIAEVGDNWVLRTCITPKGQALIMGLKNTLRAERPTGVAVKVLQALGLQENIRWECMLVSIGTPNNENSQAALLAIWNDLKTPLLAWGKSSHP